MPRGNARAFPTSRCQPVHRCLCVALPRCEGRGEAVHTMVWRLPEDLSAQGTLNPTPGGEGQQHRGLGAFPLLPALPCPRARAP